MIRLRTNWIIIAFGAAVCLSVLFTGAYGVAMEYTGLKSSLGEKPALEDATFRLLITVVFGAISFLPYLLLATAFRKLNWKKTLFAFAVIVFVIDVVQRVNAYLFSTSSTSGIIDLVLPIWLTAFAITAIVAIYLMDLIARGSAKQ